MKIIENMISHLEEEVDGAEEYAEKFIEAKARGNMARANKYKEMANDELKHAGYLHDMFVSDVEEINHVYKMTESESETWERGHKRITEKMAMVKQILSF